MQPLHDFHVEKASFCVRGNSLGKVNLSELSFKIKTKDDVETLQVFFGKTLLNPFVNP